MITTSNIWWKTRNELREKKKKKKKQSCSKMTRYWRHLSYMCKLKSDRSLIGIEHKPKKIEKIHSRTRKYHGGLNWIPMKQELDLNETIYQ